MFAFFWLLAYQVDLFKRPFTLNVMTHKKTSSLLGTLFSLGIFAVACLSFFQSNMFLKINPYILEKTVSVEEAPLIYFGNNLPISMFITNTTKEIYNDDTIFKFEAYYFQEFSAANITYTPIPIGPCPQINNDSPYKIYNSSKLSCIADPKYTLQGTFDDNKFMAIMLQLRICNNYTDGGICKTPDEITRFFIGKVFGIQSPNSVYDVSNYNQPYSLTTNTQLITLSVNKVQQMLQINKKSIFTNDDFFLYDRQTQTNLTLMDYTQLLQEPVEDFIQCNNFLAPFSMFVITSSKNVHSITRTYQKIQEALANVSGLVNMLIIFGILFTAIQARLSLFFIMGRNLYRYDLGEKKPKNEMIDKEKELILITEQREPDELKSPLSSGVTALIEQPTPFLKGIDSKNGEVSEEPPSQTLQVRKGKLGDDNSLPMNEEIKMKEPNYKVQFDVKIDKFKNYCKNKSKRKNPKITIFNYFSAKLKKYLSKELTKKEKIILNTQKAFDEDIDIVNILHRIQELEKLKSLLLTPSELLLFTFLDKPTILEEEPKRKYSTMMGRKSLMTSLRKCDDDNQELLNAYNILKNSKEKSEITFRLLQLLEDEIQTYIEEK